MYVIQRQICIMVGQRTKSGRNIHMSDYSVFLSDKMTGQKHQDNLSFSGAGGISSSVVVDKVPEKKAKHQIAITTFEPGSKITIVIMYQMLTWLRCKKDKCNKILVIQLKYILSTIH